MNSRGEAQDDAMNPGPPRFLGWRAADLAGDGRWIFRADPRLVEAADAADEAATAALKAWLEPVLQELKRGWGLAWIRGLGALPEDPLRRLYLAIGRAIGQPTPPTGSCTT